jgi:ATP-binding cassette subfamily G (WHITE) protein 2 (SNQ2)
MMLIVSAAPAGQTCGDYAGAFAEAVGGYLNNPGSEGDCQFCQYRVGDSFYNNLNITYDTRWRDFGIFVSILVVHDFFLNADFAVVLHCL